MELRQHQAPEQDKSFTVACTIGGSVFLSADKTQVLSPENARQLARQLITASDKAEYPEPKPIDKQTLEDELKLISVCQEIGGIAERNNHYTLSLTLHINQPIESLTVQQLLSFHRECVQRFNQGVKT